MVCLLGLDLQPKAGTCLLILAALQLGNDSFQSMLLNSLEKRNAGSFNVIGKTNPSCVVGNHLAQDGFSLDQRKLHHVETVRVQKIEGIEIDGYVFICCRDVFRSREMNTWLQQFK